MPGFAEVGFKDIGGFVGILPTGAHCLDQLISRNKATQLIENGIVATLRCTLGEGLGFGFGKFDNVLGHNRCSCWCG